MSVEKLPVVPLTQEAFAPYGDVVESEGRDSYIRVTAQGRSCRTPSTRQPGFPADRSNTVCHCSRQSR